MAPAQRMISGLEAKRESAGTKKSPRQIKTLESFYSEVQYPKPEDMVEYATSVGLAYSQVRIWFKERRRKERREMETIGAHMERQLSARSNGVKCSSSRFSSFSQGPMYNTVGLHPEDDSSVDRSMSFVGEKHTVQSQVLCPKDYILRKVFRKDGPPLGSEFDPLPQSKHGYLRDTTGYYSYHNQRVVKKRKIMESTTQRSTLPCEDSGPVRKPGIGKGLMTVWHAMYSCNDDIQTGSNFIDETGCLRSFRPFDDCDRLEDHDDGKLIQKQIMARKKMDKRSRPPPNKRKVSCSRVTAPKEHPPVECHLSVDKSESSELRTELPTLVDDEELELSELQAGPNPLRCSAHLSSSGRNGCPLCKDLLARFPPPSVKMKQPFSTRPWESSPAMLKKLFQVVRFVYTHFGSMDVHPFTFDEFAQAFHDKDSLLWKVHVGLLKLLLLNTERGSGGVFVPRSSKDCRFLSFLNFVREQEFNVNFWIKCLNSLTWVEILRQVLVASGFGSKNHMLNRDFFSKEKNQMVKYGLRPRTMKCELFALLSKKGSGGLKVSELIKSSEIIDLNLSGTSEVEQLIYSTLSSDITLFEKIAPSAYRLRVDPRIKGKEDPRSDTEDSGSVDDDGDASSSGDESDDSQEINLSEHDHRIVRRKWKNVHENLNKCSEIDESYSGERWLLGLMEGEYSDLSIDEKLDCLVALMDVVSGSGSVPRLEEPQRVLPNIPRAQSHASGGKIKKSTRNIYQSSDEYLNRSGSSYSLDSSKQGQSGSWRSQDYITNSDRNDSSTGVAHQPQVVLLGSDRRYNNYWLFLGPCRADDPGHRRVYFESSEDGHWEVIDSPQELLSLLSVLDSRGTREAHLLASMKRRQAWLFEAMKNHLEDGNAVGMATSSDLSRSETSSGDGASPKPSSGDGASPISDIDNASVPTDPADNILNASSAILIEVGRRADEKILKWERLQALDKWIWTSFYSSLTAVKCGRKSLKESLVRCESCHDLYWRDEKHCRICHITFEVGFDLEEKYAVHVATCREPEDVSGVPNHKVLPSQLQALKAAIHAIEVCMPEAAFTGLWMKSSHKLWVKRLRRTSSLPELLQVLVDFVGAMDENWLYKSSSSVSFSSYLDDITVYFQTMPQTTSAVALWVVRLDALIAPYSERADSDRALAKESVQTRMHSSKLPADTYSFACYSSKLPADTYSFASIANFLLDR